MGFEVTVRVGVKFRDRVRKGKRGKEGGKG